jgi:hypothetical protein
MEPDYIQYANSGQSGGGLSHEYLGTLMADLITAIKSVYPTARFSMDIAPWINDPAPWYQKFNMASFSFMNTSGGRTEGGNSRIRMDNNNLVTWSQISTLTKKTIIADAGYGVGGACDGSGSSWWQASNIENRIKDGVVAVTNACPNDSWINNLGNLAASIKGKPTCTEPTPTNYALTLTPGTGGTISASPSGTSFASGTSVKLTATPAAGYAFVSWGGALSGTTNPGTVVMDGAKSVSATFALRTLPKYALTLSPTTNGTITASATGSLDSGTVVTLTAKPSAGYKLSAWTGSVSGSSAQTTLIMNAAKTVGATFVEDATPVKLTLAAATNGTIQIVPVMPSEGYKRGTSVTLTATPAAGYRFVSWGGGASGSTNPLVLSVDSNMTVSGTFRKIGEVSNLVVNGDGSSTTNWTVFSLQGGTSFATTKDPKNATNQVFDTKGAYGENIADTAFMITQKGFQLQSGTKYYLTFRAMVSSPDDSRGAHPIGARVLLGTAVQLKKSDAVAQDTDWHDYAYEFTATASGEGRLDILLGKGGDRNWQSVLIDDIVLSDAQGVGVSSVRARPKPLSLRSSQGILDFSFPAQAGDLKVEAIAIDGSGSVELLNTQVAATGGYRASISTKGLSQGLYVLRVRNGLGDRTASFSVVK